jgi:hypothetical protein
MQPVEVPVVESLCRKLPRDDEGAEDHEASDSSEEEGRVAVMRREMKRRRKR